MSPELRRVEEEPGFFRGLVRAWDRFFFAPADPTPLAMIRICGGLLILYIHLVYSFDLYAFFGKDAWINLDTVNEIRHTAPNTRLPWGWPSDDTAFDFTKRTKEDQEYFLKWRVDPEFVVAKGAWKWSIWYHVTDRTWMAVCHGFILFAMLCLTLGLCTRIAAVVTWLGLLSYVHRSPTTLFGMDTIMIVVSLYLLIAPSGAVLSLDRVLARWRAQWKGEPADAREGPPQPSVSANFALRLLQIHVCIIYFASGVSKLQGTTWWSGTAVWGTMANYSFSPMQNQLYMDYLRLLADNRWLWELVTTASTTFTLAFEIAFLFVVWTRPLRWVMVVSAVFLHAGIAFFMGLVGFSLIMIVLVSSFIPAEAIHRWLDRCRLRQGDRRSQNPRLPQSNPVAPVRRSA
jgi:hypothetical protein